MLQVLLNNDLSWIWSTGGLRAGYRKGEVQSNLLRLNLTLSVDTALICLRSRGRMFVSARSGTKNQSFTNVGDKGIVGKEMGLFNSLFLYQPVPHQLEYGHS